MFTSMMRAAITAYEDEGVMELDRSSSSDGSTTPVNPTFGLPPTDNTSAWQTSGQYNQHPAQAMASPLRSGLQNHQDTPASSRRLRAVRTISQASPWIPSTPVSPCLALLFRQAMDQLTNHPCPWSRKRPHGSRTLSSQVSPLQLHRETLMLY